MAYTPPPGATLNEYGFWVMPNGNLAPGQTTPGMRDTAAQHGGSGVQRDERGRAFLYLNGGRNYISPAATGTGRRPDGSFFHDWTWNTKSGEYERSLNWGNLMSLVVAGALSAGVANALMAASGGAAAGGGGAAGAAGSGASGATGAGAAGAAGSGYGSGGIAGMLSGAYGGGGGSGGIWSALGQRLLASRGIGSGARLIGAGIGGAIPEQASSDQEFTPTVDPAYAGLQNILLQQVLDRLQRGSSLPEGFDVQGVQEINRSYDAARQALDNSLTSRGLATSPIAGQADIASQMRRAGSIGQFRAQLPLLERELRGQDLDMAARLLSLGRGSRSRGRSSQGGGWAGAATNIAQALGYFYGGGGFGG